MCAEAQTPASKIPREMRTQGSRSEKLVRQRIRGTPIQANSNRLQLKKKIFVQMFLMCIWNWKAMSLIALFVSLHVDQLITDKLLFGF
jgi:hypothetical protein